MPMKSAVDQVESVHAFTLQGQLTSIESRSSKASARTHRCFAKSHRITVFVNSDLNHLKTKLPLNANRGALGQIQRQAPLARA